MDEAKRKYNDEHYDWWSTEGKFRAINIYASNRAVAMANQWHEYFLWRPTAQKAHQAMGFIGSWPEAAQRAMQWDEYGFNNIFYEQDLKPYAGWCEGIGQFSEKYLYGDRVVRFTILYERAVETPYLKELGVLQMECEELVGKSQSYYWDLQHAKEKLQSILPFGKAEAKCKKEEAERQIPILREQIDKRLMRVNEIRAIVLG